MSNIAIEAEHITKVYSLQRQKTFKEFLPALLGKQETKNKFVALHDVNFKVHAGESLGILGVNGSGKSTLLKIIAGVTMPTKGSLTVHGKIAPLIELGAGFHPELTGKENVYLNGSILGKKKKDMDALYDQIVEFSGLEKFMDEPVKHYSSGMYMRLAFSVAVAERPEILLVDEILSVGDAQFQRKSLDKIKEYKNDGMTMIMVSHSLSQIKENCSLALVLSKGNQVFFGDVEQAAKIYEDSLL